MSVHPRTCVGSFLSLGLLSKQPIFSDLYHLIHLIFMQIYFLATEEEDETILKYL